MNVQPTLSCASATLVHQIVAVDESGRARIISVPAERALTVYVDRRELVTLMTLGDLPEALTLGYLRNQRLLQSLDDVQAIQVDWDVGAVAVTTRTGIANLTTRTAQKVVTSGCGQGTVFGNLLEAADGIALSRGSRLRQSTLRQIVDAVRQRPSLYKQAGSLHGCALFTLQGELRYFVEDVGRHNAVDAIAGMMWLDCVAADQTVLYTTGRLTSEMVLKGAQMGITVLISRSGTTQMGHALAQRLNMTLITRCSGNHFLLLSGHDRLIFDGHIPLLQTERPVSGMRLAQ